MSPFAETVYKSKYSKDGAEEWEDTARRVATNVLAAINADDETVQTVFKLIRDRVFMPGGRYLYASGREFHQTQNCLLLRADDTREGWADLLSKSAMALQTGAGIGIDYSQVRPSGSIIRRTGGVASGPISLMKMINEVGRGVMQGGSRRSAIWAGLQWDHADVMAFIHAKDWSDVVRKQKEIDFNFPGDLDMTNISVILNKEFFDAFDNINHPKHQMAVDVYWETTRQMLSTAEPGFSVNYDNANESLRNACCEVTSEDDSDICNLGSINLSKIESVEQMEEAVKYGTLFLLAGTVYSELPYEKVHNVRAKNRRLGLGLMGVHEWLLKNGSKYEPNDNLAKLLDVYATSTQIAHDFADLLGLSRPVKTRAIAPTGTIAIVAETTSGIEPVFCVAYKRRYKESMPDGKDVTKYQYVIDPTAKRLIDNGVHADDIEDAYTLALDVERRIKMQHWLQKYVDHGISSTINLYSRITEESEVKWFGEMLYGYLPGLRGITCYPDGARGGQPLTVVTYKTAIGHEGVVFEESDERCVGGVCGI